MRTWPALILLLAALPARAEWADEAAQAAKDAATAGRQAASQAVGPPAGLNIRNAKRAVSPRGELACAPWYGEAPIEWPAGSDRERARALVQSLLEHLAAASRIPLDNVCPLDLVRNDQPSATYMEFVNKEHQTAAVFHITSGMVAKTETDDELASILAHELAHRRYGHQAQADARRALPPVVAQLGNWSIENEKDADALGVTLLARAGYDPKAASAPLLRLVYLDHVKSLFPGLEHPPSSERAADVAIIAQEGPFDGKPRAAPLRVRAALKALGW